MKRPLFSIIVPVYNSSAHLHRCVDSIIHQTIIDFELLLIDDGSNDDSGTICDEYAKLDARIKAIHKINGGVSSARNLGITQSTGDWIAFVDSDDYVDTTFLENFSYGFAENVDLIIQGFYYHDLKQGVILECEFDNNEVNDNIELIKFFESKDIVHNGFIWHRAFKSSIIKNNNITFPEGIHYGEDGIFFFRYLNHNSTTKFIDKGAYHYILYNDGCSLTSKASKLQFSKKIITLIEIAKALKGINKDHNSDFIYSYLWRFVDQWFISTMFAIHKNKEYECYACLNDFCDKFGNCFYHGIPLYR